MGKKLTTKPTKITPLTYRGVKCLNCEHPLDISDKYCPNCSQANSTKKITFKDLLAEFFASIISYDSKLRNTLSALIFKPGKISKEYIHGKRSAYTNPFRFLLSLSFIYFIMISLSGDFSELDRIDMNTNDIKFTDGDIIISNAGSESENTKSERGVNKYLQENTRKYDSIFSLNPKSYFDSITKGKFLVRFFNKVEFFQFGISLNKFYTYEEAINSIKIQPTRENENAFAITKSMVKIKNQPSTFVNYLVSKIPFIIFFFLPIFALFYLAYI